MKNLSKRIITILLFSVYLFSFAVIAIPETTTAQPKISLNTSTLSFSANQYGSLPTNQTFTISNSGSSTLNWSISDDVSWLDVSPASGTGAGTITASINTANLTTLTNTAKISVTSNNADNSPQILNVTYSLTAYATTTNLSKTISYPTYSSIDQYKEKDYQIIGIPGNGSFLSNTLMTGSQGTDWKIFWDNGEANNYNVKYDGSSTFQITTGKAFWILSQNPITINKSVNSAGLNANGEAEIPLHKSWNLITNPFTAQIAWSKIKIYNNITQNITSYSNGTQSSSDYLQPYTGYIFDNSTNKDKLLIPYKYVFETSLNKEENNIYKWIVDIDLYSDEFIDKTSSVGVLNDGVVKTDEYNQKKPRVLAKMPMVYFNKEEVNGKALYASDIEPDFDNSQTWGFEVMSFGKSSKLVFRGLKNISDNYEVFLLDKEKNKSINLKIDSIYYFTPISNISKFNFIVAKPDIIKEEIKKIISIPDFILGNNYPNPFNPATQIPVSIPYTSNVKLTIYNTLGEEIRILYSGILNSGEFIFNWDAKNATGNAIPSGIYIYSLTTDKGFKLSKKMILLK